MRYQPPPTVMNHAYIHLADDHFIMAHWLSQLCGHAPTLEEDLTITNIALDFLGVARALYQKIAEDAQQTEDEIAFLRTERQFTNLQLCELPNHDFAHVMVKIWFFAEFMALNWHNLAQSKDEFIAAIAQKSMKESAYHVRHCHLWLNILQNSTIEAKNRLHQALDYLYPYLSECDNDELQTKIKNFANMAEIPLPAHNFKKMGGRMGLHTEFMGHILKDLQFLPMQFKGAAW